MSLIALLMIVESGPRFAEVCWEWPSLVFQEDRNVIFLAKYCYIF